MTTIPKFTGKIRDNPLIALERGNREVMLNLWREYLHELLELDPKSGRRRLLINRIEQAGDFDRLYTDWNDLAPEARGERWLAMIRAAKAQWQEVHDICLRCGECCEKSSPTLMAEDVRLFLDELLHWSEVYTLRRGEKGLDPVTGEVIPVPSERLKLKEHSGTRHCLYYATDPNRCLIYEQRPQQCREQLCNLAESEHPPMESGFLTRQDIFGQHQELWPLIATHEERCSIDRLAKVIQDLSEKKAGASEALFDMLHFDHYLRQMLLQEWEVPPGALDFMLGRPLSQILRQFGLKAQMTGEGVFQLEVMG